MHLFIVAYILNIHFNTLWHTVCDKIYSPVSQLTLLFKIRFGVTLRHTLFFNKICVNGMNVFSQQKNVIENKIKSLDRRFVLV